MSKEFSDKYIKAIDPKYMPVETIDNYKIEEFGEAFMKDRKELKESFESSGLGAVVKGAAKGVKKAAGKEDKPDPDACNDCMTDDQQKAYLKMMKQC